MSPVLGFRSKLFLMLADLLVLSAVMQVITELRLSEIPGRFYFELPYLFIAGGTLTGLYVFGCYDLDQGLSRKELILRKLGAFSFAFAGILFVNYLFFFDRSGIFGRGILIGSLSAFFIFSALYRFAISKILNNLIGRLKWLILIGEENQKYFEADLKRLGFRGEVVYFNPVQHSIDNLASLLKKKWSSVVVGLRGLETEERFFSLLLDAKFSGTRVMDLSQFYEKYWFKVPIYFLGPEWFISSEGFRKMNQPFALRVKRVFDIFLSIAIFLPAFPIMLLTAIAIAIESPGRILYRQIRTGKNGNEFFINKFRSMQNDAEDGGAQWAQKNDVRITRVGRFIRKTRIDELPQLWNVFKGDMSFVGPRPERPEFNIQLAHQIDFYNFRHSIQPGLTGWAQVLYPYGASVEDAREKLQYELYYAKHFNLLLDAYIFLKTVRVVLFGRGR